VVWGDVVSAVASANATQKQRLTTSLSNKDFVVAGRTIMEILMDNFLAEIEQDLNQKLANNSLSVDELSEILT
jgi:hypothetical protein